jgi:hypothetical protein
LPTAISWRTASYFSSRPTAATNSSRYFAAIPGTTGHIGNNFLRRARADWRAGVDYGENFPEDRSHFDLKKLCTAPLAPCVARSTHFWSPAPAAHHTYIDAFNGKTVTRETLLRYTLKSHLVNILIRGFLWKTSWPGFNPSSSIGAEPITAFLLFPGLLLP